MSLITQLEQQTQRTLLAQHDLSHEIYRHPEEPHLHVLSPMMDPLLDFPPEVLFRKFTQLQTTSVDWHENTVWPFQLKHNPIGKILLITIPVEVMNTAEHDHEELLIHSQAVYTLAPTLTQAIAHVINTHQSPDRQLENTRFDHLQQSTLRH